MHNLAKSIWTYGNNTHMWTFPKLLLQNLVRSTQLSTVSMYAVALRIPFPEMKGPKPVPP